jgi:hypothetical protein
LKQNKTVQFSVADAFCVIYYNLKHSSGQGRIQKFSNGGADEKNEAKGGADGTKLRTFRRKLLEKRAKSDPNVGAAVPTAPPPWIRHCIRTLHVEISKH